MEVESTIGPESSGSASLAALQQKFKRDLNRVSDSDRITRKRGLQKLLEDIPWKASSDSESRVGLFEFINGQLLAPVLVCVRDQTEKCRELALHIIKETVDKDLFSYETNFIKLVQCLCSRINDIPFPEQAEELRLIVVEVLYAGLKAYRKAKAASRCGDLLDTLLADALVKSISKILTDSFPAVKKLGAELLHFVAKHWPESVRMSFSALLKALSANALHQHNKTRTATLKALGVCLACVVDGYSTAMKESIVPLLGRISADRSASTRAELANLCKVVLSNRIRKLVGDSLEEADQQLVVLLLILMKDEAPEVATNASEGLSAVAKVWDKKIKTDKTINAAAVTNPDDVVDGEAILRHVESQFNSQSKTEPDTMVIDTGDEVFDDSILRQNFLCSQLNQLSHLLLAGLEGWTVDSRVRYLGGLHVFVSIIQSAATDLLPQLIHSFGYVVRDEEAAVRDAAQAVCVLTGTFVSISEAQDLLVPRARGLEPGGDTSSQRTTALRIWTLFTSGFAQQWRQSNESQLLALHGASASQVDIADSIQFTIVAPLTATISDSSIFEFRESYLREAIVLCIRIVVQLFPELLTLKTIQQQLFLALSFMMAQCPGETDVVPTVAGIELHRLCYTIETIKSLKLSSSNCSLLELSETVSRAVSNASADSKQAITSQYIGSNFGTLLRSICFPQLSQQQQMNSASVENWESSIPLQVQLIHWAASSPAKCAFAILVRLSVASAWHYHTNIIKYVIAPQVQPKARLAEGSTEAINASYAAQRGEEAVPGMGDVDIRLSLLAILEEMIRVGSADWSCGASIAQACEGIFANIIVPNLVWRVGRVEATIRKVSLAACYGLLKAGAANPQSLYTVAPSLVPLIASHLDDTEHTPRVMSCYCLNVLFERLRGAYAEQSLQELYPKLLKRLDDSSDDVRVAVCSCLINFFQCAAPRSYSCTLLDYSLDQLFIHLDDSNEMIQDAVEPVIIQISKINKELVEKKCESNQHTHRTPYRCTKILGEVLGYEIVDA